MSNDKNNIFVQLYKPLDNTNNSQQTTNVSSPLSPELDPFSASTQSEYAPILEYVEPQIDEAISSHLQSANPPFISQPTIPLSPTATPPVPGIQPMQFPPLPLSEADVEKELKTDIYTAIRWLAEWCIRQLQIYKQSQ